MSRLCGGDSLNWNCYKEAKTEEVSRESVFARIGRKLSGSAAELGFNSNMDITSNKQKVKVLLRCSASGCFDMHNICCKACGIKKCRYKCNFLDKEICEYQYMR